MPYVADLVKVLEELARKAAQDQANSEESANKRKEEVGAFASCKGCRCP